MTSSTEKHVASNSATAVKNEAEHTEQHADPEHIPQVLQTPTAFDLEYLNDKTRNKKLARRIDWRLVPLCSWMFLLNYLDRGNIGNAKVMNKETGDDMLSQTGMNNTQYAITVSLFSVAYTLFEVPSNWIMKRYVRPSVWLSVLLFCWGGLTMGFAGVNNYASVVVIRFLIGVFEAGFFPAVVYLITFWYRVEERASRISVVVAHATLAGAFGGAIGYGVGQINGAGGLEGFRWLFIIEGAITVGAVLLVLIWLPDWPARARWLNDEDRKFAEDRLKVQGGGYTRERSTRKELLATCFSPRMLIHYLLYLLNAIPVGSLTFFAPTIVTGLGYTSLEAQLLTIPPWVVGYLMCMAISFSADHFNARGYFVALAATLGGIGWLTAGLLPREMYVARYGALVLAACGGFPNTAPLSAWVTCNVPSFATMAIATAINNSTAGIASIIAQWIWIPAEATAGYPTGNFACAAFNFAVAILAVGMRFWYARMNRNGVPDVKGDARVWAL